MPEEVMVELSALLIDPDYSKVIDLLEGCKELNKLANLVMNSTRGYPGQKKSATRYRHLQHTYSWPLGRATNIKIRLKMYGKLVCDHCGKDIIIKKGNKGFVMHHEIYNWSELYTNNLLMFVHFRCHKELHKK